MPYVGCWAVGKGEGMFPWRSVPLGSRRINIIFQMRRCRTGWEGAARMSGGAEMCRGGGVSATSIDLTKRGESSRAVRSERQSLPLPAPRRRGDFRQPRRSPAERVGGENQGRLITFAATIGAGAGRVEEQGAVCGSDPGEGSGTGKAERARPVARPAHESRGAGVRGGAVRVPIVGVVGRGAGGLVKLVRPREGPK
jgi:hypothetical protein